MIAEWNGKQFKVLNSISIKKSSREITFNDIEIEFKNGKLKDLPLYMQEINIYDEGKKIFCGFVDEIKCPELRKINTDDKILTITLLSPRKATTKRIVTICKTDTLNNILNLTLSPLLADGFTIKETNLKEQTLTVQFISKTIEECLNFLSNKCSFWWNIDENKNITINSIEYQFNKNSILEINSRNCSEKIKGLIKIVPSVEGTDYANIINLKNARIYYNFALKQNETITLKKGDVYIFENPVDISYETAKKLNSSIFLESEVCSTTHLHIICSDNTEAYVISGINTSGDIQPRIKL